MKLHLDPYILQLMISYILYQLIRLDSSPYGAYKKLGMTGRREMMLHHVLHFIQIFF